MATDRWHEVDALFQAALERAPEERAAFLAEAAAHDAELQETVRSLLEADERAGDFLEGGAAEALAEALAARPVGRAAALDDKQRIGPYRVVRLIARGGMGAVYEAERADGRFEQRVAVKVLDPVPEMTDGVERFLTERQILAALEHPNIARLLGGGATDDGRPYLVMEYIDGRPIDVYCEERALTFEQRLELFTTVAEAVQHAHRHLVIHRDLKPSNILVTDTGEVKLLDFGIAKLLDDSELAVSTPPTRTGLHPLTPEYASPEQVRGEPVTTASDIYQLGVVLYRLLAGRLPYETESRRLVHVVHAVTTGEPTRPSTAVPAERGRLRRRLRGDIDAILLKTLRKEPERRYSSVERLVDDIRRNLAGLPVSARRGTWRYRAAKVISRNRVGAAAVAVVGALLIGYFVTLTVYAERLERERNLARVEAAKAAQVSDFLVSLFEYADPSVTRGESLTARELLEAGTERAHTALADQPEVQATMLATLARVYQALGMEQNARPLALEALETRERLHGAAHPEVVRSRIQLGSVVSRTNPDSARTLFERALAAAERVYGPEHRVVAEILTKIGAYGNLALERRVPVFDRAIRILRAAGDTARDQLAATLVRSTYGNRLLPLETKLDRLHEALAIQREVHGEESAPVAETLSDIALALETTDPAATDTLLRRAVSIHRAAMGETHPITLLLMNNHAAVLRDQGAWADAERAYREVLRLRRRAHPDDRIALAYTLYGLGRVVTERGRAAEAVPLLREASATFAGDDSRSLLIGIALADALREDRRFRAAEEVLLGSWRIIREGADAGTGLETTAARALATLYEAWGRPDEAARYRPRS